MVRRSGHSIAWRKTSLRGGASGLERPTGHIRRARDQRFPDTTMKRRRTSARLPATAAPARWRGPTPHPGLPCQPRNENSSRPAPASVTRGATIAAGSPRTRSMSVAARPPTSGGAREARHPVRATRETGRSNDASPLPADRPAWLSRRRLGRRRRPRSCRSCRPRPAQQDPSLPALSSVRPGSRRVAGSLGRRLAAALVLGHGDRLLPVRHRGFVRVSCPRARSSAAEQETLNLSVVGSSPTGLTSPFHRPICTVASPQSRSREGEALIVRISRGLIRRARGRGLRAAPRLGRRRPAPPRGSRRSSSLGGWSRASSSSSR